MSNNSDDSELLTFPCDFPIKMMGRETSEFHATVRSLVEKHTGPMSDDAFQSSLSRNGRFVSITVTISAQSQEQLDNIYRDVSAHEAVLMAL
jgi:putative lipoic acid-binding regulatory protein